MNEVTPAEMHEIATKTVERGRYQGFKTEAEWKIETLRGHAPRILRSAERLRKAGSFPYAVMLPEEFNPGTYDGPDATDISAQFCGLPIVWGDRFSLLVEVGR